MESKFYEGLVRKYPIQKTLRWEIKPIGKTRTYLTERNIIETDEHMADSYKKIKKMIFSADLPFHRIAFWSNHRVGCVEPFIPYCIQPGEDLEWKYGYVVQ